jgi:hypothetical protein
MYVSGRSNMCSRGVLRKYMVSTDFLAGAVFFLVLPLEPAAANPRTAMCTAPRLRQQCPTALLVVGIARHIRIVGRRMLVLWTYMSPPHWPLHTLAQTGTAKKTFADHNNKKTRL